MTDEPAGEDWTAKRGRKNEGGTRARERGRLGAGGSLIRERR